MTLNTCPQLSTGWTTCAGHPKNKRLFTVILSRDIQYCRLHVFTFGLCTSHAFFVIILIHYTLIKFYSSNFSATCFQQLAYIYMHMHSGTHALLCRASHYDATIIKSLPSPLATIMTWIECGEITRFYCIYIAHIQQ